MIAETDPRLDADLSRVSRWIVLACDPARLRNEVVGGLATLLRSAPLLVVARAAAGDSAFARLGGAAWSGQGITGSSLRWSGPGPERSWTCRSLLDASILELTSDAEVWATLEMLLVPF